MPITEYDGGNLEGVEGFKLVDDPKAGVDPPDMPDDNDQDDGPGFVANPAIPGTKP